MNSCIFVNLVEYPEIGIKNTLKLCPTGLHFVILVVTVLDIILNVKSFYV